jgi:hypothetical protein
MWVLVIGWPLTGLIALGMDIYDHPAKQENIGWADTWPVIAGPMWLVIKLWTRYLAPGTL